jgi:hypothetical protein
MTAADRSEAQTLQDEITALSDRNQLLVDCFTSHQSSVLALISQNADWALIEEHRDKATFYYESFLDLMILIGRKMRRLGELTQKS